MDTPELPEHAITSLGRRVHVRRRMAFLRGVFTEPFLPLPADLLALPRHNFGDAIEALGDGAARLQIARQDLCDLFRVEFGRCWNQNVSISIVFANDGRPLRQVI